MAMKLLRNDTCSPALQKGSVLTLGNFDGVHLGHQALLRFLKQKARELNLPMVVLIFEPQPAEFFHKNQAPTRLSSFREKLKFLTLCEVDYVYCVKFNASLASMSAKDFAYTYLFSLLQAKYILVGDDFRFGHQRSGNIHELVLLPFVKRFCKIIWLMLQNSWAILLHFVAESLWVMVAVGNGEFQLPISILQIEIYLLRAFIV
jgi:cytidyltransferase-like protein